MAERNYTAKQLDYLRLRARQAATSTELGIPKDEQGLSEEELSHIILELKNTPDSSRARSIDVAYQRDLIGIIYYAGYSERERYRTVLDQYLHDPHHAREILKILCQDWELAAYYKQELLEFVRGMPWEASRYGFLGSCQHFAVNYVCEKWSSLLDPVLLREIIALYERSADHPRDRFERIAPDLTNASLRRLLGNPPVSETETVELAKELASQLEAAPEPDREEVSSAFISALLQERSVDD